MAEAMIRGGVLVSALVLAVTEPVIGGEADLLKYAITQGGLLFVVLVLLWSYRRDFSRQLKERDEQFKVIADLVSASTREQTILADLNAQMVRAVEQLTRVVERFR